jgi:hypothetical protein
MKRTFFAGAMIFCFILIGPSILTEHVNAQGQDWVARHTEEDRVWAQRAGLTPEIVRKLRLRADVPDEEETYIDSLDAKGLRARNQIFLVTAAGNGHCLELFVFARRGSSVRKVWSVSEMPGGAGFCRASPRNPEAFVTRDGRIRVKIDYANYEALLANVETEYFTYAWNGRTYKLVSHRKVRNRNPERMSVVPGAA